MVRRASALELAIREVPSARAPSRLHSVKFLRNRTPPHTHCGAIAIRYARNPLRIKGESTMPAPRYVVKPGDTLWDIAHVTLGHGNQWPRLWRYNNRRDVIKVTGRGIPNPDLINPGQILLLPVLDEAPQAEKHFGSTSNSKNTLVKSAKQSGSRSSIQKTTTQNPTSSSKESGSLSRQLTDIKSPISIKYRLDDLKMPPIYTPLALIETRMTGDVVLMSQKQYPAIYVTQRREIEAQVVQSANQAYNNLVMDNRLVYDPNGNSVTMRTMMVSQSKTPDVPSTAIGIQVDSKSLTPKLRFEIRLPKLEGSCQAFDYVALDVKIVIEITHNAIPPGSSGPTAQPVREPTTDWRKVVGVGLLVAGTAIVVGTLIEDFLTAGVGAADDPASFAAAGALFTEGMAAFRTTTAVMPVVTQPATINLTLRVVPGVIGANALMSKNP